ncbi:efflux RND transporter permease subunit [Telmatospirillum sp. J64-1]|uniref:efflux RND transporter permease subunit n=1 Tax=Telmatospirillum sp. J64-1 TaxID=2502183 RepID=UPI00115C4BCC|nr:efflux RND transporter permease subunit [Telmatospirillum sp. J64-1]
MRAIIHAAISHARTILTTLLLVLIAGSVAWVQIPKESSPDVNIPYVFVLMSHSGISPSDAERLLVRPMEQQVRVIEGLKEMRATAYEGGANIILEFDAGFDADKALRDVREKVDRAKSDLPPDTDEPLVQELNFSLFPVLSVAIHGSVPERTLLRIARELQRNLEGLPNVLEADIAGDREEQVEIIIDPVMVESYGLNANDMASFIQRSNRLVAAGAMDTGQGRFAVKVPGLIENVQEIMALPVKVEGDAVVRLSDIATVRRGFKDPEGFARINGQPALVLEISKRIGANIIETIEQVRAVVEAERTQWPANVQVSYLQDQSSDIRTMLSDLQNNVVAAVLLVMVVVVGALGLRSGLLVGVAIPGSFLMGILVIAALGLTVNMVVLFGLILAVGMLVDGAIVVTEYADRKMSEGMSRRAAYALASTRMSWPVIASTATTLAAFLPLLFWTGMVGEFMKYLPITLLATLTASLLMALIFVPTLGAVFGKAGTADPRTMKALAAGETGNLDDLPGLTGIYTRSLRASLRHPGKVVAAALLGLVVVQAAYGMFGRGVEFFPSVEPENAVVLVHAGGGNLSAWEQDALMREVEERVLDLDGITAFYTRTGRGGGAGREASEDQIGSIQLEFAEWDTRRPAREILADLRRRVADLAGLRIEVREQESGPPVGKPVQMQISARDPDVLPQVVETLRQGLDRIGGFVDVEDTRPAPGIQWEVVVDRAQAARFGADVSAVGDAVRLVTNGLKFTDYRPDDAIEEVDIVARFPEEYRTLNQLDQLRLNTAAGSVPVGNFVQLQAQPRVGQIERVDGRRVMYVRADVEPGLLPNDKVQEIRAWLATVELPQDVTILFQGEDQEQAESAAFLSQAFSVALFLIAIILVTQFNSFYSAFLILSAVVMSTLGVMLGLLVTGQPFGIVMSGIGVIALAGIVVNNNIVLIDTYDRLRRDIADPMEAILRTGAQRLRPVLLTTATTILGLLPMMVGMNIDFIGREVEIGAPSTQWWQQLSTAIVFGLAFSTVLTLIVTPCALMLKANIGAWRSRRRTAQNPAGLEQPGVAE